MAVSAARPERITPSLTIQAPLSRDRGPGLVVVSLAGTSASPGGDPQQLLAQEGYAVAHLKLSPSWGDVRIRDELREATESLDFYDKCSNKSRYGVIVYTPSSYPYLSEAVDGNGEISAAVFLGETQKPCRKTHLSIIPDEGKKSSLLGSALEFLRNQ